MTQRDYEIALNGLDETPTPRWIELAGNLCALTIWIVILPMVFGGM